MKNICNDNDENNNNVRSININDHNNHSHYLNIENKVIFRRPSNHCLAPTIWLPSIINDFVGVVIVVALAVLSSSLLLLLYFLLRL